MRASTLGERDPTKTFEKIALLSESQLQMLDDNASSFTNDAGNQRYAWRVVFTIGVQPFTSNCGRRMQLDAGAGLLSFRLEFVHPQ